MDQAKTSAGEIAGQNQPPPVVAPYEIILHCLEQTTATISLDGENAIEKIIPAATLQIWQAAKSFSLTLSSTSGVNLTINGAPVPIPEAAGQSVTIQRP